MVVLSSLLVYCDLFRFLAVFDFFVFILAAFAFVWVSSGAFEN